MIGPFNARGGISAVVSNVLSADVLQRRYRIALVRTSVYQDGGYGAEIWTLTRAVLRFLRMMIRDRSYRIVHIHVSRGASFYRKLLFVAMANVFRKIVILHIHTGALREFYLDPKHRLRQILVRWGLRRSDLIVVLGACWMADVSRLAGSVPVRVLPNPAPEGCEAPPTRGDRVQKGNVVRLVFVGFLYRAKGVHELVQAVAKLLAEGLKVHMTFCGVGPELPKLQREVESLGISRAVDFPGWLERNELAELLRAADIFVLPSYSEGLPNALLEAMAAGLPVVCTSVGAIPDVCAHTGGAYLFEPGDIPALVRGLRLLIEDPYLRSEMGRRNLSVVDNMRPELIAREWSQLYSRLLKPGDSRLQH